MIFKLSLLSCICYKHEALSDSFQLNITKNINKETKRKSLVRRPLVPLLCVHRETMLNTDLPEENLYTVH